MVLAEITQNKWVIDVLQNGYSIEFLQIPPWTGTRLSPDTPVLRKEVSQLLQKRAISRVPADQRGNGVYSTFFLTSKKSGGVRAILNLKPLNQYIKYKRFRMESLRSIISQLKQGQLAFSIDLKDAYLHVPVRKAHHHYLRFALNQEDHYQYEVVCFGINAGPRLFTKLGGWA
jgi:hypothetical protein